MNNLIHSRASGDAGGASPLSVLVHAASAQTQTPPGATLPRLASAAPETTASASLLEEQLRQNSHAGALQHSLSQLRGGSTAGAATPAADVAAAAAAAAAAGSLNEAGLLHQNATLLSAQQHQAAALALANDIRAVMATAQLSRAPPFQNHNSLLLSRAASLQQQLGSLGAASLSPGLETSQLQRELSLRELQELERRQLLSNAAGPPVRLGALSSLQQLEQIREAQHQQGGLAGLQNLRSTGHHNRALLQRASLHHTDNTANPTTVPSSTEILAFASASPGTAVDDSPSVKEKETPEKAPGSVIVPCRARGMPMDHNFKTAYFVIPENVSHGDDLVCSYFACRNAGMKFRFCKHCKVPVAKRNFRRRHKHGESLTKSGDSDNSDDDGASLSKGEPLGGGETLAAAPYCFGATGNDATSFPTTTIGSLRAKKDSGRLPTNPATEERLIAAERERLWALLLAKRPPTNDGDAVSSWLMEILAVSDRDTPLHTDLFSEPLPVNAHSVLISKKRPPTLLQKDDEATDMHMESFSDWKDRKKHKTFHRR